mmetsp:Transcript_19063/g.24245  ORF Transcript_19063/g.24245 Transcript_19063/m.24245 type:complete len:88 (-) Transcript_19063:11-274(-)
MLIEGRKSTASSRVPGPMVLGLFPVVGGRHGSYTRSSNTCPCLGCLAILKGAIRRMKTHSGNLKMISKDNTYSNMVILLNPYYYIIT